MKLLGHRLVLFSVWRHVEVARVAARENVAVIEAVEGLWQKW